MGQDKVHSVFGPGTSIQSNLEWDVGRRFGSEGTAEVRYHRAGNMVFLRLPI